jgi:uncharacterized membrane protein
MDPRQARDGSRHAADGEERVSGLERAVFLSDGVFAIALTLLVLEVRLPALGAHETEAGLGAALVAVLPKLYSYGLSFAVLALYWLRHHQIWRSIVRMDERLVRLNLGFLGLVALLPFPSAVLGEHGDLRLAWVVFVANNVLICAGLTALWLHAARHRLTGAEFTPERERYLAARSLVAPAVFLASVGVSFLDVRLAEFTPALLVLMNPALRALGLRAPEPAAA